FLYSPAGGAFSLALEQRSCFLFFGCSWSQVGSAQPQNGVATLNGSVGSGTYRWRVTAQSGSGAYTLLANPR
ncbi:MAG: subtilisin, partial [Alcanivorax sp.]|nr:subtilisin [Alcanivorax sp.]